MEHFYNFIISLFGFLSITNVLNAQFFYIDNSTIKDSCGGQLINQYQYWDIYQTKDDYYDGAILVDCIPVKNDSILLTYLETNKKLFFRLRKDAIPLEYRILNPNSLKFISYSYYATLGVFDTTTIPILRVIVQEIDTALQFEKARSHTFNGRFTNKGCNAQDEFCFPSQKFSTQYIDDIIFEVKLTNNPNTLQAQAVFVGDFNLEPRVDMDLVHSLNDIDKPSTDSIVDVYPNEIFESEFFAGNYLILHEKNGVPSETNVDLKEIRMVPNPSDKKKIILHIGAYESLYFQEFTGFSTQNVEGSNSDFHNVEILLDGGNMCLQSVELISDKHTSFRIKKGHVDFADRFSCLMFGNNGTLTFDPNTQFIYGEDGNGILGMRGGKIVLKENAHFTINCPTAFKYGSNDNRIYLSEGSKLTFTDKCYFKESAYLYIFGRKEQVEMNALDEYSKSKIIFLEEKEEANFENLIVNPNPAKSNQSLSVNVGQENKIQVFDITGKLVYTSTPSNGQLFIPDLNKGLYILKSNNSQTKLIIE